MNSEVINLNLQTRLSNSGSLEHLLSIKGQYLCFVIFVHTSFTNLMTTFVSILALVKATTHSSLSHLFILTIGVKYILLHFFPFIFHTQISLLALSLNVQLLPHSLFDLPLFILMTRTNKHTHRCMHLSPQKFSIFLLTNPSHLTK